MINFIKKNFKEILLYGVIGLLSASLDSYIFFLLHEKMNLFLCNFISVNSGITLSFFLNTYFNFKKTDKMHFRAFKFFTIGYFGLALSSLILFLGVTLLSFEEMYVKIFSVFFVAAVQYFLNKFITFRG